MIRVKPEVLATRKKELRIGDNGYDYSKLRTRTLMLLIADYTHAIDECEDAGGPRFTHDIPRDIVERELSGMINYLRKED